MSSKKKTAPTSRPVHPCVLSIFDGNTGSEHSTWACLTSFQVPNLVTAQSNTLRVYTLDQETGTLILTQSFTNLAGSVCYLETLGASGRNIKSGQDTPDDLLIGFAGNPRVAIVSLSPSSSQGSPLLLATSLLDLTPTLTDHCMGSVTPLDQDLVATMEHKNPHVATLTVVLGGGVCVAALTLRRVTAQPLSHGNSNCWHASEPYIFPLATLHHSISIDSESSTAKKTAALASTNAKGAPSNAPNVNAHLMSISHGFGDILSVCFLSGYLEPTMCMLHAGKNGRVCSGRLGRPSGEGASRYGMIVTAVSVTVSHRRCAVLWSVEVPADAFELIPYQEGCILICVNSVLQISQAGRIMSMLGVNGWVRSTTPPSLMDAVQPNPSPLPRLSIQLDGSHLAFVNDEVAVLALRGGQLYLLQPSKQQLSLMPLGKKLGSIGQVANLLAFPFADVKNIGEKLTSHKQEEVSFGQFSMGLLFAGSRLGDSSLLGYALQSGISLSMDSMKSEGGDAKRVKQEGAVTDKSTEGNAFNKYERVLQLEEDALYAPVKVGDSDIDEPHVTEAIDGEDDFNESEESHGTAPSTQSGKRKRYRLHNMSLVRSLKALDSITTLGPLGPSCEGPLSRPSSLSSAVSNAVPTGPAKEKPCSISATAQVFPCGYGSSGGVALVTALGRDDRSILAEADCINVQCMFGLPRFGLVLLAMAANEKEEGGISCGGGTKVLRLKGFDAAKEANNFSANTDTELSEVSWEELCVPSPPDEKESLENPIFLFSKTDLLAASEFNNSNFLVLVRESLGSSVFKYALVALAQANEKIEVRFVYQIGDDQGVLLSVTPIICYEVDGKAVSSFGCTWSSGNGTVTTVQTLDTNEFVGSESTIIGEMVKDTRSEGTEEDDNAKFYQNDRIVAIDTFSSPKGIFSDNDGDLSLSKVAAKKDNSDVDIASSTENVSDNVAGDFDEEDLELYGLTRKGDFSGGTKASALLPKSSPVSEGIENEDIHVAVCRQSGSLQIFKLSDFSVSDTCPKPIWEAVGFGHGIPLLASVDSKNSIARHPHLHKCQVTEFRIFFSGPSIPSESSTSVSTAAFRSLCLIAETNMGDVYLYKNKGGLDLVTGFSRVPLGLVARSSIEQSRHRAKLRRKGIVAQTLDDESGDGVDLMSIRYNRLHPFKGISGQDGLFAATAKPMWFISERGHPTFLCHRSRHAAPAGGKPRPVTGFCSGLHAGTKDENGGFLTLHERIGRVGTQRLTVFNGISNVYAPHGLFPGAGLCIEKVPLGVTVRRIQFIDDNSVSSRAHPLYALLVSREIEIDQSSLNDDGLAQAEKQRLRDEREVDKVKRQVEADLGGFDVEQEWVEEIERENCFEVDKSIGGAPPIKKTTYALWIVDASNNWSVVDSHELGEFEHGMQMNVMALTDVPDETGTGGAASVSATNETDHQFIALGTAIVDQDGEDVGSKGRVLLFKVKKEMSALSQVAELELVYEKDVLHGPVTSLSCLKCEGRSRIVIGAGSDVNVEQWGNGKLTQVGFFRATMQIIDIVLFKTFFLLTDAYDSLNFLVWRESDKSLTLLAKDYEPIPVYAAGIMSRGGSVSFVCQDDRQNLQFFQYAPGDAAARGGNKLVCRTDIHLGAQTVEMQSHFCRSSLLVNSATPASTLAALKQQDSLFGRTDDDQRLGVYFGTSDGSYVSVIPLSEPTYWRLTALQSVMINALESNCALSHRAWRLYRRTPRRGGCRSNDRKKGVIDGDLIGEYADLPMADQEDLASAIGSTVELILDNILELNCSSMII